MPRRLMKHPSGEDDYIDARNKTLVPLSRIEKIDEFDGLGMSEKELKSKTTEFYGDYYLEIGGTDKMIVYRLKPMLKGYWTKGKG